jgi:hypothetical protein
MSVMTLTQFAAQFGDRLIDPDALKALPTPKVARYQKPPRGTSYWFLNSMGEVINDQWADAQDDNERLLCGNLFRGKPDADAQAQKLKITARLEALAEAAGGVDWSDHRQTKWHIVCAHDSDATELIVDSWNTHQHQGAAFFPSKDACTDAMDEIGRDKILMYLFGVT